MSRPSSSSGKRPEQLEEGPRDEPEVRVNDILDWDGPNDPENPRNWPLRKRWVHIIVVALLALVTNMGPTMCAPGTGGLVTDFNLSSHNVSTLAITIYVLGLAIGPMFIAPLSEVYGRLFVYHNASLTFAAFLAGNALSKSIGQFMAFRFLSGCAGGTPMALGGGTIADVLGPVIGGFIADKMGWRWTFWILAILGGVSGATSLVIMRETQLNVLLQRRSTRLRRNTGDTHIPTTIPSKSLNPRQVLFRALVHPSMLLIRSPIVLIMSLYTALVFGLMYLLFTTFSEAFEGQYGFSTSMVGLVYLGLGVALVAAMLAFGALGDRVQKARMRADSMERPRPEYRLVLMIWFSPLVGVGLFFYGWTVYYKVHWIVPVIGTVFIGFGAFFVIMPTQLYLVDLFGSDGAVSALGANNLLRYLSSTFLPLAGPSMYRAFNYGWGNTLLSLLAMGFVPAPILFYRYGEWLRAKTAVKL